MRNVEQPSQMRIFSKRKWQFFHEYFTLINLTVQYIKQQF